jgi:hypothetical protein
MRIADIVDAASGRGFYKRRNKILPKHVDFVVCDKYFKPVLAIELNGSSHRRADRIESDGLKQRVFNDAGLPLIAVPVCADFAEEIAKAMSTMTQNTAAQSKDPAQEQEAVVTS